MNKQIKYVISTWSIRQTVRILGISACIRQPGFKQKAEIRLAHDLLTLLLFSKTKFTVQPPGSVVISFPIHPKVPSRIPGSTKGIFLY